MAKLIVTRGTAFRDRFRAYQILVDGTRVAAVQAGARVKVEISPGPHEVQARIDWCSSPRVNVEARDGDINLEVGSCIDCLWFGEIVARITWKRSEYLFLREA